MVCRVPIVARTTPSPGLRTGAMPVIGRARVLDTARGARGGGPGRSCEILRDVAYTRVQGVRRLMHAPGSGEEGATEPGVRGEHVLQRRYGTAERAASFYRNQVLDHLNPGMRRFIDRMEMLFISTADRDGRCDCSLRAGPPGFVRTPDTRTLAYPEYRGNGVLASLGNVLENPNVGLLMVDFLESTVGLHVNGRARVCTNDEFDAITGMAPQIVDGGPRPERWVVVEVEEAYIHCSKHVPLLAKRDKAVAWGTDDRRKKGGDYFRVRGERARSRP